LLVDSHCHLNYLEDPRSKVREARAAGVSIQLCIGVDEAHICEVLALADEEPDVWATVGQHPEAAAASPDWIEPLLSHPRVVAVGETGLDYFHDSDSRTRALQRERFGHQLGLAVRHDLPVVVHTRAAEEDTLSLIREFPGVRGVLHCFTESWSMASEALDLGFYVSISGIVTFRNGENVRAVARRIPDERLLVETDAPWLAPVPHRGKPNAPAYVRDTAAYLAELRGVDFETLAAQTTANFLSLFSRVEPQNSSSYRR
jgi:TatD DNase family protein